MKQEFLNKGMTLVEILVAISVFFTVIVTAIAIFSSSIKLQKRSLASQELLDQVSYVMEYMSRSLRMAKKELGEGCLSTYGSNYESISANRLRFINHLEEDDCQEFYLSGGRLKYDKAILTNPGQDPFNLTSEHLTVESLQFNLEGKDQGDPLQPRVTISLKIKGRGLVGFVSPPSLNIQTTVSQRNLDITY